LDVFNNDLLFPTAPDLDEGFHLGRIGTQELHSEAARGLDGRHRAIAPGDVDHGHGRLMSGRHLYGQHGFRLVLRTNASHNSQPGVDPFCPTSPRPLHGRGQEGDRPRHEVMRGRPERILQLRRPASIIGMGGIKLHLPTFARSLHLNPFAGSVAISGCGRRDLSAARIRLCDEPLELLDE
jgi:hypothetical protein